MSDLIGKSLGRYHILEQLGEGGMATVFKAYDTRLERDVAIKMIRSDAFPPNQLENILKRFEREAKSLAKLSHPNIVKVLDYGDHEGAPYLVMEYLPGDTLRQQLGKSLPWQDAVHLLTPIAEALEYAHKRNIIHRDIKPSNILLAELGQPMLTDFGIAKILEGDDSATLTGTGVGIGTPEYMAPEQWTGESTTQSDIYSLGVVMYEMISGRKPYMATTPAAILLKQANEPLPRPKQFAPDLPRAVENILLKALSKSPKDRYADMAGFVNALESLGVGKQTGTIRLPRPKVVEKEMIVEDTIELPRPPVLNKNNSNKFLWLGGGVIFTLVAIGIILFFGNLKSSPPSEVVKDTTSDLLTPSATLPKSTVTSYQCTDSLGCVKIAPNEPIHIAFWGILSGPDSALGEDTKRGVVIALDDKDGKLLGHDILLTTEDALCTSEGGAAAANKLVADKSIVALIGSNCSIETMGGIATITKAGLTTVSPSNTRAILTDPSRSSDYTGYLRIPPSDALQGNAVAEFAYKILGVRKAATINDGSAYTQALQQAFADDFTTLGGQIVAQEVVDASDTNMYDVLNSIAAQHPDFLYYPIFVPAAGYITAQVKDISGLENVFLASSDGVFDASFLTAAGPNVKDMYLSSPDFQSFGESYDAFLTRYRTKYGGDTLSNYHAFAYDAANMIFAAVEKVAVVESDGTIYVPRKALRDALYATRNFNGITGILTCNQYGDCGSSIIAIYQVVNSSADTWNPLDVFNPNPKKVYP